MKYEAHELVAMLEDEVFKVSKEDAKTKEYRDRCNKLQMKLKVSQILVGQSKQLLINDFLYNKGPRFA